MHQQPPSALTGLCLHYFLALRSIALAVHLLLLFYAAHRYDAPLPWVWLLLAGLGMAAYTLHSWRALSRSHAVTPAGFMVQLLVDILGLALVTGLTGGVSNPFISLLMLPVVVAAATLPLAWTWSVAGVAGVTYTALLFVHRPFLPWGHHGHDLSTHLLGMWAGFLLAATLVAAFVARIGQTLAAHERELSLARERALAGERTLALGTLAAGTAHELGTPLATIATLARELERSTTEDSDLHGQARLLREEVGRCKEILARMASDAGNPRAEQGAATGLDAFLERTLAEWQRTRPTARLITRLEGPQPAPHIVADRTLTQAIMNLLHNAADVSPAYIELSAAWGADHLHLEVLDNGPGLPSAIAEDAGRRVLSTRATEGGMGLGLYLTRTTLERMGGQLQLTQRAGGGVRAVMDLPLRALLLPVAGPQRDARQRRIKR